MVSPSSRDPPGNVNIPFWGSFPLLMSRTCITIINFVTASPLICAREGYQLGLLQPVPIGEDGTTSSTSFIFLRMTTPMPTAGAWGYSLLLGACVLFACLCWPDWSKARREGPLANVSSKCRLRGIMPSLPCLNAPCVDMKVAENSNPNLVPLHNFASKSRNEFQIQPINTAYAKACRSSNDCELHLLCSRAIHSTRTLFCTDSACSFVGLR